MYFYHSCSFVVTCTDVAGIDVSVFAIRANVDCVQIQANAHAFGERKVQNYFTFLLTQVLNCFVNECRIFWTDCSARTRWPVVTRSARRRSRAASTSARSSATRAHARRYSILWLWISGLSPDWWTRGDQFHALPLRIIVQSGVGEALPLAAAARAHARCPAPAISSATCAACAHECMRTCTACADMNILVQ